MAEEKSFEQELEVIKEIATKLSTPQLTLADGMALYKDGMDRLQKAQAMLDEAKIQLEELEAKES